MVKLPAIVGADFVDTTWLPGIQPGAVDQDVITAAKTIRAMRRERTFYLDDHAASDGAFSVLLAMYLDAAYGLTTPIDRIVAAADVPLSIALYVLGVLIETEQVSRQGPASDERYTLTPQAERAVHHYLADSVVKLRRASKMLH